MKTVSLSQADLTEFKYCVTWRTVILFHLLYLITFLYYFLLQNDVNENGKSVVLQNSNHTPNMY